MSGRAAYVLGREFLEPDRYPRREPIVTTEQVAQNQAYLQSFRSVETMETLIDRSKFCGKAFQSPALIDINKKLGIDLTSHVWHTFGADGFCSSYQIDMLRVEHFKGTGGRYAPSSFYHLQIIGDGVPTKTLGYSTPCFPLQSVQINAIWDVKPAPARWATGSTGKHAPVFYLPSELIF